MPETVRQTVVSAPGKVILMGEHAAVCALSGGIDSAALLGLMSETGEASLRTITLAFDEIDRVLARAADQAPYELTVNLEACPVADQNGFIAEFEMDDFRRTCLMEGLDRIGLTLRHEGDISAYEDARSGAQ